jgi:hypothetical protein
MSNETKTDSPQGKDIPSTRVEPEVKSVSVKTPQASLESDPSRQLRRLPGSCVIRTGATFWYLGLVC